MAYKIQTVADLCALDGVSVNNISSEYPDFDLPIDSKIGNRCPTYKTVENAGFRCIFSDEWWDAYMNSPSAIADNILMWGCYAETSYMLKIKPTITIYNKNYQLIHSYNYYWYFNLYDTYTTDIQIGLNMNSSVIVDAYGEKLIQLDKTKTYNYFCFEIPIKTTDFKSTPSQTSNAFTYTISLNYNGNSYTFNSKTTNSLTYVEETVNGISGIDTDCYFAKIYLNSSSNTIKSLIGSFDPTAISSLGVIVSINLNY